MTMAMEMVMAHAAALRARQDAAWVRIPLIVERYHRRGGDVEAGWAWRLPRALAQSGWRLAFETSFAHPYGGNALPEEEEDLTAEDAEERCHLPSSTGNSTGIPRQKN